MKKIDFTRIENVKHGSFTYEGKNWTMANYPKNEGFSANGLWNDMTDGEKVVRVYKKDVKKVDIKKAIALFN